MLATVPRPQTSKTCGLTSGGGEAVVARRLLEREHDLGRLRTALDAAREGRGRVVLVSGEAGIGKSQLVGAFVDELGPDVRRVVCDDLATPRPLGPFLDLARHASPEFREALDDGDVLSAFRDELRRGIPPRVVIIEDVHWIDEASIDVLTYTSRRIADVAALVVLTFRSDEVTADHPLTRLLGRIPPKVAVRVALQPLTSEAITTLAAGDDELGARIAAASGGNPFLATELLAAQAEDDDGSVPASIRDAVLGRHATLPAETQSLLDVLSVVPGRAEFPLLARCHDDWMAAATPAEQRGIVEVDGSALQFRHELAREAVRDRLSTIERRALHERVLAALRELGVEDVSRLVHHADGAGDEATILELAPAAARAAAARSSHREAVAHYVRLAPYRDRIDDEELATLFEEYAHECYLLARGIQARWGHERALEIRERHGDDVGIARNLRALAFLAWWFMEVDQAEELIARAQAAIETAGDSHAARVERARVLATTSRLAMFRDDWDTVEDAGGRAIELAAELGETAIRVSAMNNVGVGRYTALGKGPGTLQEALELALANDLPEEAGRLYINLAYSAQAQRDHELWGDACTAGIAHITEHELFWAIADMYALQARLHLDHGEWAQAAERLDEIPQHESAGASHVEVDTRARLLSRQGEAGADDLVAASLALAQQGDEPYRLGPAAVTVAEHAWLTGRLDEVADVIATIYELIHPAGYAWLSGAVGVWHQRAGGDVGSTAGMRAPYRLLLDGDPLGAAAAFEALGMPYERADALASTGEEEHMLAALEILDQLGAAPLAALVRKRLRDAGATAVPRGPNRSTRANPANLTPRQVDVAELVAEGLTNADIADRLVVSRRTVDHHVSAVLSKLGVASRQEVAEALAAAGAAD